MDYELDFNGIEAEIETYQDAGNRKYEQMKRLRKYYELIKDSRIKGDFSKIVVMLEECFEKDDEVLKQMLKEDIDELEKCFDAGAYKATLILAGSILEAFLIDWLSEKDGIDYFTTPYMVTKTNRRGEEYQKEDDRLVTYIKAIKELEMPTWMEPSEKADNIRNQRNLVHVKLCLKDNVQINKETCATVIHDLKDIISTRSNIEE